MNKPLRDHAARSRIVTDLTANLLVEAGAGSGKTHEMAARMAAGVANGTYALEHMAAVTFTRKAAAELRGRFHLALEELRTRLTDPSAVARVDAALSNLERFFAGTIHAFCARLLRERPIEAGMSPGFTELDEVETELLLMQGWRDFRAQARAAGDADLERLAEAGIQAKELDAAFKQICLYEDVDFPTEDIAAPDGTDAWQALAAFWAAIESELPNPVPDETTCDTQKKAVWFARDWRMATGHRRTPARLAELLSMWDFEPGITQKWWSDLPAEKKRINQKICTLHENFRADTINPYLTAWRRHLYAPCVRVLTKARDYVAYERRRRNTVSFNDLLIQTARVLREHADVRDALQQKYRHLFVDEFQDTDPIQAEIMLLLAGDEPVVRPPGRSAATPKPLRRASLFVVGDPKQSIYRFRRADISTYNLVRARLEADPGGGVVTLTTNFRSVPALCDWANTVFVNQFPSSPTDKQPQFAPLQPNRDPGPARAVRTLTTTAKKAEMVGEQEAARIARYIRSEVAADRRKYRDFLILTRKHKGLRPLARALEALEIPIEVSGGGGFAESVEVRALAELLVALADPQDSVALVGVLRGRFFGLSDPQLYAWREAGGYFGIFSELAEPPTTKMERPTLRSAESSANPVAAALESLRRWYRWTRLLPAGAALDRILDDSGYLALAAASPGGVEAGDLLHAVDRVRAAVEAGMTLADAAEALVDEDLEAHDVESLPLEPGRRDVVRLMNLHKAKGLEAPVVFLADPLGGFTPRVDVRIVRSSGADGSSRGVGYLPIREKKETSWGTKDLAEPPDWDAHEAAEQAFLNAEVSRLLYVAATRAKDLLVVGRAVGAKSKSPAWTAFDPYLSGVPELAVPDQVSVAPPAAVDLSADAARAAVAAAEIAHDQVREPTWAATSVTAEEKHLPGRPSADAAPAAADDPTRVITADTPSRRADVGLAWGTLVHGLLEHAMRHPAATRDDLRRLAMWLTFEVPELRDVIDEALDTVEAVVRADFWQQAIASDERQEEVPFTTIEPGALPTVVSGAIDLAYRTGAAWHIVDYKTDRDGTPETLAERYTAQVEAYARAWTRVTGAKPETQVVSARRR